jgi:hypothetical protein
MTTVVIRRAGTRRGLLRDSRAELLGVDQEKNGPSLARGSCTFAAV